MKKSVIIGIVILVIVVGIIFIKNPFKQETEGVGEEKQGERLEPKFIFVEGDSENWVVQSSKIGKYVLSPSWFRFEYESEEQILVGKQFGNLDDAKNNINQLSEIKKEGIGKATDGYSLIFGEKGMEETLVNLNIAFSSFPPKDYVIYKYESGEEVSEEKGEQKKEDGEESKEPPKETKQEETLTPEEKEIAEFLEAEDEQFDYPAVNRILADFRNNYFYYIPGNINSFTNEKVSGVLHFDMDLRNLQDESGEPVVGLGATFTTELVANNWKKDNTIKTGPPIYVFSYGDVPQEEVYIPGGFRPSPYVEFNEAVSFTPGFDASRSADKTVFSGPDTQTLTITVTPREKDIEEKSDGMSMCIYTIEPGAENLVDVIITSPTTDGEHFVVSEDRHSLRIYDIPVKTGTPWSVNLTLEVTPKPGVSKVEFLPFVSFLWNPSFFRDDPSAVSCVMESGNSGSKGTTTGSSVSCVSDEGIAKWKAKGNYIWDWQAGLSSQAVMFEHLQERIEDE